MQPGHTRREIAVVDDDRAVRESLAFLLEVSGYEVAKYASAEEFLRDRECHRPVGLILDQDMPEATGLQLAERLRAEGWKLPILLVTARPSQIIAARAAELGIKEVLEKPSIEQGLSAFCAQLDLDRSPAREAYVDGEARHPRHLRDASRTTRCNAASARRGW